MNDFYSVQWKATDWIKCFLNCFRSNRKCWASDMWCDANHTHVWAVAAANHHSLSVSRSQRPNNNESDTFIGVIVGIIVFFFSCSLNKISYFINKKYEKQTCVAGLFVVGFFYVHFVSVVMLFNVHAIWHTMFYWIDSIERNQISADKSFKKKTRF